MVLKMKNKALFYIFLAFFVANIVDAVTSFFILPGESNPLYLLTKSIVPVLLFKFGIVFGVWYFINRNIYSSNMQYYIFIVIIIFGGIMVSLGAVSNIYGILHPAIIQESSAIPTNEKIGAYSWFVSVVYLLPAALCLLLFFIYDKTRPNVVVDKEFFKKRKWWQP